MRLSPFSQPHAAACCGRGACDRGLPFARQRTARNLRQQIKPKMNSGLCCRLVLPVRCTSSCDKEGAIRPKEARESPVPRPARQQQAVDVISLLLQESLNSQQQTQVSPLRDPQRSIGFSWRGNWRPALARATGHPAAWAHDYCVSMLLLLKRACPQPYTGPGEDVAGAPGPWP